MLREVVGERADGLVERSMDASAVDGVAREIAKGTGTKIRAVTEDLWGRLRAAGAVRDSRYVQLRQRAAGLQPSNEVRPSELGTLERDPLHDALGIVRRFRGTLQQKFRLNSL